MRNSGFGKVLKLVISLFLLWVCVFNIFPLLRRVDFLQPLFLNVEKYKIETDALFYTGSDHSSESEMKIRLEKKYWNKEKNNKETR